MSSQIRLQWADAGGGRNRFRTGVSLHSHTLHSRESLQFIAHAARYIPPLAVVLERGGRRYREIHRAPLNLSRGWWTPPLGARDAWAVEKAQLETLDLDALVSLSDHDDIEAPMSLQVLDECRGLPISVEWTVPFRETFFHLGIHNLPSGQARALFADMDGFRRAPVESEIPAILSALAGLDQTLLVFNHPLWDEKGIGRENHGHMVCGFLELAAEHLHAFELNGLRPWSENRSVIALADASRKPVISGGDRHALEPNALVNLTNSASFAEFVEEVRSGWSDVLILRQYRERFTFRILHNMIDVLRTYHQHANGWKLWSDRVFYRCEDQRVRSLTELFGGGVPLPIAVFVKALHFAGDPHIRRMLRGAFPGVEEVRL